MKKIIKYVKKNWKKIIKGLFKLIYKDIGFVSLLAIGSSILVPSLKETIIVFSVNILLTKLGYPPIEVSQVHPIYGIVIIIIAVIYRFVMSDKLTFPKKITFIKKIYSGVSGNVFKNKGRIVINYKEDKKER